MLIINRTLSSVGVDADSYCYSNFYSYHSLCEQPFFVYLFFPCIDLLMICEDAKKPVHVGICLICLASTKLQMH